MISTLFEDVGEKIKAVAKISTIVECAIILVASVVVSFIIIFDADYVDEDLFFMILLLPIGVVIACTMAWLSNICLYGFGELICRVTSIDEKIVKSGNKVEGVSANVDSKGYNLGGIGKMFKSKRFEEENFQCSKCHKSITEYPCKYCKNNPW